MKEVLLDTDTVSFFLKGIPQVKSKFYDAYVAQGYYNNLRRKNLMIGHADVLIAATALHYDLQVVTNNQAHFQRIEGLELDNWV